MPQKDSLKRNTSVTTSGLQYQNYVVKEFTNVQVEELKTEYSIDDHTISLVALEQRYSTHLTHGLTQEEADVRLARDGANCLARTSQRSNWLLLADFIFCGFASLLWFAAFMSLVIFCISYSKGEEDAYEQLYFGCVVVVVIIATGSFGFYQESANVAIIQGFQKLTPKSATVIRGGVRTVIPSEEVVLGDVVILNAGEWIPADIRLIEVSNLKVDNSAITGESKAQSRTIECTNELVLESANMVFYSTAVVEGGGLGVAVNRGDNTVIGRIAGLTTSLKKSETPIRREINYFIKFITILAVATGIVFFILCMLYGYDFFTSFRYFIALVIANVPEGLPVTLTACMTLTAKRMASKNCMVKKLEAIETLGCCNVICSDKTGTLTQNKMKVVHMYYDNQAYYVLNGGESLERSSLAFEALSLGGILCSRAHFSAGDEHLPIDERRVIGDASEAAILKCMESLIGQVTKKRMRYPKKVEIPFNSTNKYQLSVHNYHDEYILLMKGAPEGLLERCTSILRFEETQQLTEDIRKSIQRAVMLQGQKGQRVLGFADLILSDPKYLKSDFVFTIDEPNFPTTGLRFIGFMALMDPPRASVPDAVSRCRTAGIKVTMVTGDHPITAAAIAKQVGILSSNSITAYDIALSHDISLSMLTDEELSTCNAAVITGSDLRDMESDDLEGILRRFPEIVFARTSPQQKLKIVEAYQKIGNIVAVTGDGVNDSPALKKADIGIAMGITGTDVSKEAADMILLDDNFSSIVTGIEEGRLIFDNLKKSVAYLLTSNVPEIIPFVVMVMAQIPPVISVLAIMVIDVGTDLWPAISLAYEEAEADIMTRSPRNPNYDKLVNSRLILLTYAQIGVIQTCASFSAYIIIMLSHGFRWEHLVGLRKQWGSHEIYTDSYNQRWSRKDRMVLTRQCYSGYFLCIVITQVADLIICKTRKLSIFDQGMTNWVLNAGIFVELSIALLVVFCPGIHTVLQFEAVSLDVLLIAVPYALMIFVFDEIRKYLIRRKPDGLIAKETYY